MSSSVPPTCTIVENPDIAGIGVRLSIYLPALLVTLNSGFFTAKFLVDLITGKLSEYVPPNPSGTLSDMDGDDQAESGYDIELTDLEEGTEQLHAMSPTPSIVQWSEMYEKSLRWLQGYLSYLSDHPHYFESAKSLERSLFLIGSAIIVSAFLDARYVTSNIGLPPYHALLVLNLSFLNNLAGSSSVWFRLGALFASTWLEYDEDQDKDKEKGLMSRTVWWSLRAFDVFGLSTLQMVVFIAFGIWFWVSTTFVHEFSGYSMTVGKLLSSSTYNSTIAASSNGTSDPSQCVTKTFYWAFAGLPIESALSIQVISFIFYVGTAAFPLLGPLVSIVPTIMLSRSLPLFLGFISSAFVYLFGIVLPRIVTRCIYILLPKIYHLPITIPYPHPSQPLFPTRLSPSATTQKLIIAAIMMSNLCTVLYLIVSTEKTISINFASTSGEGTVVINGRQWTYGQTLALLTAIIGVAMYGAEVIGHWREAWIERQKRIGENKEHFTVDGAEGGNGKNGESSDRDGLQTQSQEGVDADVPFSWTGPRMPIFHMERRASSI